MSQPVTLKCLECGKEFQTEEVTLMGLMFFRERYCLECLPKVRSTDSIPLIDGRARLQLTRTIKEVTRRNIEPKSGKAPFTLFEIEDDTGTKWTTKNQSLALEAHSLVNKLAQIEGTIKQNGEYKNYYLESITEAVGEAAAFISENGNTTSTPAIMDTTGSRDEAIWRQTATKVAAIISDNPGDFWVNVEMLLGYYRTGVYPGQRPGEEDYATAAAFTGDDGTDDLPF